MEKQIIEQIKESLRKEERTSKRITRALRCLECNYFQGAIDACDLALRDAEIIEQRLAIMALKELATKRDKQLTEGFLKEAYEI